MTDLAVRLLELAQEDFPLDERPFLRLAERLGVTEADVIGTFADLQRQGAVRELSAFFDPAKLGYVSTLACMTVPAERVDEVAAVLSDIPEVTHNYLRDHVYNIWFTVIARSLDEIRGIIRCIEQRTGLGPIRDLPAKKVFKIRVLLGRDEMAS